MHEIRPQWNKSRKEQQKKLQKMFKHIETEKIHHWQFVEEISGEVKKFLESNENENRTY
jgi:hypothetical protein